MSVHSFLVLVNSHSVTWRIFQVSIAPPGDSFCLACSVTASHAVSGGYICPLYNGRRNDPEAVCTCSQQPKSSGKGNQAGALDDHPQYT